MAEGVYDTLINAASGLAGALIGGGIGYLTQKASQRADQKRETRQSLCAAYAEFGSAGYDKLNTFRSFVVESRIQERELAGKLLAAVQGKTDENDLRRADSISRLAAARAKLLLLETDSKRRSEISLIYDRVSETRPLERTGEKPPTDPMMMAHQVEQDLSEFLLKIGETLSK